ncbi:hypothetical protein DL765_000962 [Monosporascus sp. GIB2]|nr:hypothetical protein DL765_000962 [Monosporascus sp. GIB2]
MAGADRVEGCLFGNGERTDNVDLVTLALNLYTQGNHLNIDFSDLGRVIDTVEICNKIPVHPHAPGKGGAAWIILRKLELDLPHGLQIAFNKVVQKKADELGRELLTAEITDLFEKTYFLRDNPGFTIIDYSISVDRSTSAVLPGPGKSGDTTNLGRLFEGIVAIDGQDYTLRGRGNGPISSLADALRGVGIELDVADYKEHAMGGRDVKAATYIECTAAGTSQKGLGRWHPRRRGPKFSHGSPGSG